MYYLYSGCLSFVLIKIILISSSMGILSELKRDYWSRVCSFYSRNAFRRYIAGLKYSLYEDWGMKIDRINNRQQWAKHSNRLWIHSLDHYQSRNQWTYMRKFAWFFRTSAKISIGKECLYLAWGVVCASRSFASIRWKIVFDISFTCINTI